MQPVARDSINQLFPEERRSAHLCLPSLESVDWSLLDYLGWIHPDGQSAYVTRWFGERLCGMKLRRTASHSRKPRYEMCSWCGHIHKTRGTALFSVEVRGTDGRRTLGNPICSRLDCSLHIRHLLSEPPLGLTEALSLQAKVARLDRNRHRFFQLANRLDG